MVLPWLELAHRVHFLSIRYGGIGMTVSLKHLSFDECKAVGTELHGASSQGQRGQRQGAALRGLIIATGARPRQWKGCVAGTPRTRWPAEHQCPTVVMLGSGLIGIDIASTLDALGLWVHVVSLHAVPMAERVVMSWTSGCWTAEFRDQGPSVAC